MAKDKKTKNRGKLNPPISLLVLVSSIAVIIQILGGFFIYYSLDNWGDRSNFGDMFGAIGTLFSGLAFAGVIYTILLQREEIKGAADAQQRLEQSLTEQSKALTETARLNSLSFFPSVNCSIKIDDGGLFFLIQNPSNIPAFSVDTWIVGIYDEKYIDIPTFLVEYVKEKEYRDTKLFNSTEEGLYGIHERLWYPNFPQKQQISVNLEFPILPISLYALVQFSDVKGTNYHQLYYFFEGDKEEAGRYRLGALEPTVPKEHPVLEYKEKLDLKASKMPVYLDEFVNIWNSSISNGYILSLASYPGVEDRGEWMSI